MHFLASVTVLAASIAGAAASPQKGQPYRLAVMNVADQSLQRRDTIGYVPETTKCGTGNTCAEACGAGFAQCPSGDNVAHCFNPTVGDSCCTDNSGNSCAKGFYCTHDSKKQTWCCPDSMDLAACAAAYTVTGVLEQARSTTAPSTTSTPPPKTTSTSTSTKPSTTSTTPTTTSVPVVTETKQQNTTICPASSSGYTTAWTGLNSTVTTAKPTQPSASIPSGTGSAPPPPPTNVNAAAATGVSALLLVAAGVVALL
ncbi:prp 4 CRoW domain-containing protein [Purpureocillium lavendulum]|uniref:Prp 4 CRoW domain-containing protein n=1 Tax=Purpureocillium lavendulum TaxID=1247861 RepID=A0AB34G0Q3_9HYPO|nr:prp 4 CRoW domain-containing protein [Purpureocillium lavendulum]